MGQFMPSLHAKVCGPASGCQDLLGQNQRSCQKVRHNRHPYVGKLSAAKASEAWKTSTSAVFAGRALPK